MASVPSVRTRTDKQGQFGVPGEPLRARGTSAEPALGHVPICLQSLFLFSSSPGEGCGGVWSHSCFLLHRGSKKSPEHIFREKGRKGIFSFLTQEEDLLQFPICLPCWAELAGESPKGTPPGGNQVDELMGRLSRDSDTMPASPNRQMHVRTCAMEARGAMCWIKARGAGRTGGHWGPKFHQKV